MKEEKEEALSSAEMAAIDENCKFFGLSSAQLMENAGAGIANVIKRKFEGKAKNVKVTVMAGKGNNGGDAFVAARHLQLKKDNFDVRVILVGNSKDLRTEESRRNWQILHACGYDMEEITDSSELRAREPLLKGSDVIIDAIFGTGVRGKIREPEAMAIDLINETNTAFVVSGDIPSGLDSDTGESEKAVRANVTVTFHRAKKGLLKTDAKEHVGELVVAGIGIPEGIENLAGPGDVRLVVRQRKPSSHKGDNGRVLIVGGGPFSGAPTLAALGALRAGADWVTIAAPKSVSAVISSLSPNLIVQPLSSDILVEKDVPTVLNLIRAHDVVVIGMGLGAEEETKRAARMIIEDEASKRVVVDAEGFYGLHLPLKMNDKFVIVTPHVGEFSKMGIKRNGSEKSIKVPPSEDIIEERINFVKDFSSANRVTTLMKGPTDIISDGVRVKQNKAGNAGMTVGGTGDVLAGVTGAFFAIVTDEPLKAATAAAFVNGAAGDIAFEEKGFGLLATDVVGNIPGVMKVTK
uniref:Bifunctional NAD(P)H-hydrate repair enzyme n=1 Tax=Candidatus Methanophagaceae archaeon ANME-1 ERB6 TaxID=2759912 RepID=A0A7G9YWQ6_9EURY|nr:ATP-dependent (S)-NAD(P)H-hydrate dehydratase [Methanosarcinales archaeon ANME-1 ERB6]QNO52573.1 ATP-dependent (S)-NAD(P)H-hydrate dehydratase [Methanosarcinales archaeon ANME-1 ERB6]QNO53372.1 ATP-dependent (S)-NAD(P)H-hydrate dehydratase [Methanosarcinales archaeon ANME-1 ERB6]